MQNENYDPKNDIFYRLLKAVINVYKLGGVVFLVAAFAVLILNFSPDLWYRIDPNATDNDTQTLLQPIQASASRGKEEIQGAATFSAAKALPPVDLDLPTVPTLQVEKVGINSEIHLGADGEKELEKGVWRQSGDLNPINGDTIVLAAHRFGWLSWTNEFRTKNSFYNLPKLSKGDKISYIYKQRQYTYVVRETFKAQNAVTVDSDLLLYTCTTFNSPERFVVLADLDL